MLRSAPVGDERVLNPRFTFVSDFESALSWTCSSAWFFGVCKGVAVIMRAVNSVCSLPL